MWRKEKDGRQERGEERRKEWRGEWEGKGRGGRWSGGSAHEGQGVDQGSETVGCRGKGQGRSFV